MTMILVDPAELNAASETLRGCAVETADIGSQLWSCVQCAMPADLSANLNALVSAADRVLDATAVHLLVRSVDLANRATIAANDPVAATTVAIAAPTNPNAGLSGVIGGMNLIGGNSGPVVTIGGTSPYASTSIVGGGGPFGDGSGFYTGTGFSSFGTAVISDPFGDGKGFYTGEGVGSRRNDGPYGGVLAIAETAEEFRRRAQARIDAIIRNPLSTPTDIRIAMNAQSGLGNSLSHSIAPSVSELEARYGPMTDSQIRAISPHTLFQPTNILAGV